MTQYLYKTLKDDVNGYSDGDCHNNLKKVLGHLDPTNSISYNNWLDDENFIMYDSSGSTRCACSKKINYVHRVKHKTTGDLLYLGSACINKFNDSIQKRANRRVRKLKNPGAKYCSSESCETGSKIKDSVIAKYPNKTEYYHQKCLKNEFEWCYECQKYIGYDCKCYYKDCVNPDCYNVLHEPKYWENICKSCYAELMHKHKCKQKTNEQIKRWKLIKL